MHNQDRFEPINIWMKNNERRGRISGSSILLAQNNEKIYQNVSGLCSQENQIPYDLDTIVRIYSMTKPITSVACMQLVEQGLIHLDMPISEFFPKFSKCYALKKDAQSIDDVEPTKTPTLKQLLTHTSGLTYDFNSGLLPSHYLDQGINFGPNSGKLQKLVDHIANQPLAFRPGSKWEYSIGIDLIGAVIEHVTSKTLAEYFETEIFNPLCMTDTSFSITNDKQSRFSDCYTFSKDVDFFRSDNAQSSEFHKDNVTTFSGGGGLLSTLSDYFQFAEMLRQNGYHKSAEILKPETISFMKRNHLNGDIASMGPTSFAEMPMTGMGFGIGGAMVIDPAKTGMAASMGDFGWGGIASTYFWIDPKHHLTCIFFTQLIPSSSHSLRSELKALIHSTLI